MNEKRLLLFSIYILLIFTVNLYHTRYPLIAHAVKAISYLHFGDIINATYTDIFYRGSGAKSLNFDHIRLFLKNISSV